jgi:tetratricopeptide (TPR) repeat protein
MFAFDPAPSPMTPNRVQVWQGTISLASSDEGDPDENPMFDLFVKRNQFGYPYIYPYTMRNNVRNSKMEHSWRAIYLENEYIKCIVLPDLGGHIYTCIDKISGKSMFYANPTIKKALVALRGAWAAFGVEFNYPVSHSWVSISPVDFAFSDAPDGSASVTVGNRDRVYGMEWTVKLILRPGSALLEQEVDLVNCTDLRRRFYWWNNAAVEAWDDTRICYPTQFTAGHHFSDVDTWPVNSKGLDLSILSNHTDGWVSRFVYGSYEPFMGVYHPRTETGVVHYAEYRDVPAKKIWSWGVDPEGLSWRSALSDNDSAYLEVQAGLFRNQETYGFMEPQHRLRFTEFWMPVRGIGGISRANLNGVVSIARKEQQDGKLTIVTGFNANRCIPGARIQISDADRVLFEEATQLDPATTWSRELNDLPREHTYTFILKDENNNVLLQHTEGVYDWVPRDRVQVGPKQAHLPPEQMEKWTEGDFLEQGTNDELLGNVVAAWDKYQAGLARFPSSFELLKKAGRLGVTLCRFAEASRLLKQCGARATWDAEIRYYRGIAELALDHEMEAREELEAAYRSPSFRCAAGLLLAELYARRKDFAEACSILDKCCPDPDSRFFSGQRCAEEMVALQRAGGNPQKAKRLAEEFLNRYVTSSFLRNELSIMGESCPHLDRHLAADTGRILNLVTQYNRLGLYQDSLDLLSRRYPDVPAEEKEPGAVNPASDPILAYYRGYCREKLGQSGHNDFVAASRLQLRYSFPNQAEFIAVLRAALRTNPSDSSARYLLGNLWFSCGLVDPAIEEWRRAFALNPSIPTLAASLGRALLEIKDQPEDAEQVFIEGLHYDSRNPAVYVGLDNTLKRLGRQVSERINIFRKYPDPANLPPEVVRNFVIALREDGQDEEADMLLERHFIPRKEGEEPLRIRNLQEAR